MIKILLLPILLVFVACQGKLKVGVDPDLTPITFYQDGSTTLTGYGVDLLAAMAKVGNIEYEFIPVTSFPDLFTQLADHKVDLSLGGGDITDRVKKQFDFSVPYNVYSSAFLAKKGTDIRSAQDLKGKNIAVLNADNLIADAERILGKDSPNIHIFTDKDKDFQSIIDGTNDASIAPDYAIEYYIQSHPELVMIQDPEFFAKIFQSFLFPKGSDLVDSFNEALTTVLQNGEDAEIYEKWFGVKPDVDLLLEAGEYQNPYEVLEEWAEEEQLSTEFAWSG